MNHRYDTHGPCRLQGLLARRPTATLDEVRRADPRLARLSADHLQTRLARWRDLRPA